jgi:catechol 2,3-dioxygenase-like lactoylglutathione lyase family enzyme
MLLSLKTRISTPDYLSTRAFYERVFGMVVAEEWDEPGDAGVILAFKNGKHETLLEICRVDHAMDFSGLSLQFRVGSLSDFMATLPSEIDSQGPQPRPWGSTYLYLRDPNGILIVVYEDGR